jgi:hypothetical protein
VVDHAGDVERKFRMSISRHDAPSRAS